MLRRVTGQRRIGHAGTLDPFATGLLIVAVGREATKDLQKYVGLDKTYEADFVLGATTETLDPEREVLVDESFAAPEPNKIAAAIGGLVGPILQVPPMYSAIKRGGQKMYDLARRGKTVELEPRPVTIYEFSMMDRSVEPTSSSSPTVIHVRIRCSSGTYVRALARDLAAELRTTGYVRALRRTQIGSLNIESATRLGDIRPENWQKLLKNGFDQPAA